MVTSQASSAQAISLLHKSKCSGLSRAVIYFEHTSEFDSLERFDREDELRTYARSQGFCTERVYNHHQVFKGQQSIKMTGSRPFMSLLIYIMERAPFQKIDALVIDNADLIMNSCDFSKIIEFLKRYDMRLFAMDCGEVETMKIASLYHA